MNAGIAMSPPPCPPRPAPPRGFTLVELLVVVALVALLGATLLPALAKAKVPSQGLHCLGNSRRLALGWALYAEESGGRIVRTAGLDALVAVPNARRNYPQNQWCMGTMDQAPSWTNTTLIEHSLLYPFVNDLGAYKCPADRKTTRGDHGPGGTPTVRSVAMNNWMNPINAWAPDNPAGAAPVRNFRRVGDVSRPATTWVTMDEHPSSINDGWLICDPTRNDWVDAPASHHQGAAGISFADGHAEMKRWRDPALLQHRFTIPPQPRDGRRDLRWLQERSTY
jgi:prepilin-type N-terminal cleavage/methylation domain-containing protein/prepilin-type processing-associated H-X9-DG protein